MRHVLLACVACGALSTGALAQDGFTYSGNTAGGAGFDWTGPYLGAQVGGGWQQSDRQITPSGFANSYDGSGWVGGAFGGYNIQATNNIIFGVEADISASNVKGNDAGVGGTTDTTRENWDATLNARVGAPFGPTLLYATGGLALAGVSQSNSASAISGPSTLVGWNVGGGLDVALTDKIFGRVGLKYKSYGKASYTGPSVAPFDVKNSAEIVTVGVGMKLK